jgi:hypothetical protein
MNFDSPWQYSLYVQLVAFLRWFLRRWTALENRLITSLTEAQNRRVHRYLLRHRPESVLLIMPRCVKQSGCRANVRSSLAECISCTACPLGQVARLCDHFQVKALVAFRSHIAFELARQEQPDLIIASACEDRLIKALRNVPEIPALLAPLTGMERRCVNAGVDLPWLTQQLAAATNRPAPAPSTAVADLVPVGRPVSDCPVERAAGGT